MLSPDLDLSSSGSSNRWGIFRFLWYPYNKLFSHRGISHSIIFGTLTRIIYLFLIYSFFLFIYFYINNIIKIKSIDIFIVYFFDMINVVKLYKKESILIFIGLNVPGILHVLADDIYSFYKKKK